MAEWLALPTSDHGITGSNPAGGKILPEPKRRFIAQSFSCSPFHRLEMTEILLKGRKTLTHPSIQESNMVWYDHVFLPIVNLQHTGSDCSHGVGWGLGGGGCFCESGLSANVVPSNTTSYEPRQANLCFEHSVITNFNCACPGIQRG